MTDTDVKEIIVDPKDLRPGPAPVEEPPPRQSRFRGLRPNKVLQMSAADAISDERSRAAPLPSDDVGLSGIEEWATGHREKRTGIPRPSRHDRSPAASQPNNPPLPYTGERETNYSLPYTGDSKGAKKTLTEETTAHGHSTDDDGPHIPLPTESITARHRARKSFFTRSPFGRFVGSTLRGLVDAVDDFIPGLNKPGIGPQDPREVEGLSRSQTRQVNDDQNTAASQITEYNEQQWANQAELLRPSLENSAAALTRQQRESTSIIPHADTAPSLKDSLAAQAREQAAEVKKEGADAIIAQAEYQQSGKDELTSENTYTVLEEDPVTELAERQRAEVREYTKGPAALTEFEATQKAEVDTLRRSLKELVGLRDYPAPPTIIGRINEATKTAYQQLQVTAGRAYSEALGTRRGQILYLCIAGLLSVPAIPRVMDGIGHAVMETTDSLFDPTSNAQGVTSEEIVTIKSQL